MTGSPKRAFHTSESRLSLHSLRSDGGSPTVDESAEKRHRILRTLREQLQRHPAITTAQGIPEGHYAEVRAEIDPTYMGREAAHAIFRITWVPNPTFPPGTSIEDRKRTSVTANFVFHYSESSGFDCGWHLEPNPHVNGHLHYQERDDSSEDYSYNEFTLNATSVVGVLWEVLDALESRLGDE